MLGRREERKMIMFCFSEGEELILPFDYKWNRELCDPFSYITCLREFYTVKSLHLHRVE